MYTFFKFYFEAFENCLLTFGLNESQALEFLQKIYFYFYIYFLFLTHKKCIADHLFMHLLKM